MNFINAFVFSVLSFFLTLMDIHAYFYVIPVEVSPYNNLPYTAVEIEKKKTFLVVDLGSKLPLSLEKEFLEGLSTRYPYGTAKWKDAYAQEHETSAYIIPEVKFGDLIMLNVVANAEENENPNIKGCLGRTLLSEFNLLLDFSKRGIFLTDQFGTLHLMGYHLEQFIKVPFDGPANSIIFSIELDNGLKRFALDTGASTTFINASFFKDCVFEKEQFDMPVYTTSKFCIGDHDFGQTDLHVLDFFTMGLLDGILGMDFLQKHKVYIDFENKYLYIKP